jgi:hypothetical protein
MHRRARERAAQTAPQRHFFVSFLVALGYNTDRARRAAVRRNSRLQADLAMYDRQGRSLEQVAQAFAGTLDGTARLDRLFTALLEDASASNLVTAMWDVAPTNDDYPNGSGPLLVPSPAERITLRDFVALVGMQELRHLDAIRALVAAEHAPGSPLAVTIAAMEPRRSVPVYVILQRMLEQVRGPDYDGRFALVRAQFEWLIVNLASRIPQPTNLVARGGVREVRNWTALVESLAQLRTASPASQTLATLITSATRATPLQLERAIAALPRYHSSSSSSSDSATSNGFPGRL